MRAPTEPHLPSPAPSLAEKLAPDRWLFSPLVGVRFEDWWPVLKRHGADIPPRYWPRTAFTTGMSALNSALARREAAQMAEAGPVEVKAPVFVIGHHRSGTTHLWNLLSQDPGFAYPNVVQALFPHTFLSFEGTVQRFGKPFAPKKRPQDNVAFSLKAPLEEERALCTATFLSPQMVRHFPNAVETYRPYQTLREASVEDKAAWGAAFRAFAEKLLVRHGRDKTLLFKEPAHTGRMKLLLELFPDARFIHIHRHPCDVFRSTWSMEKVTADHYAYQKRADRDLEDFIFWRYRTMYDAFFEDRAVVPEGQFAELGFEDLERAPVESVAALYEKLSLGDFETARAPIEAYAASLASYRKNAYKPLPGPLAARIRSEWAPSFEAWGYDP